jgi:hypothetical protein
MAVDVTKASQAWNSMDINKQQAFVKSNAGFDPSKY